MMIPFFYEFKRIEELSINVTSMINRLELDLKADCNN